MLNPILRALKKQEPFIYFHTHVVDRKVLDEAVTVRKSLELDLSVDETGKVYVGHPLPMYKFYNLPPPRNLPLETILAEAEAASLYLVFDCKDIRVLPVAQKIINEYGADNCLLHACTSALVFKPYSKKIVIEPHWEDEQIELEAILKVKRATGVPLALCCRGISLKLLASQGQEAVFQKILRTAEGIAEVVVLNLPKDETPPMPIINKLLKHGILTLLGVDHTAAEDCPKVYIGTSDYLAKVSASEF